MAPKRKPRARRAKGSGAIIALKNGRFRAELIIDGRLISRTAPDRQTAEAILAELQKLKSAEINVGSGGQSVTAWFQAWLVIMARQVAPQTWVGYKYQIETYILPVLGTMRLDSIRAHHIQALINNLTDDIKVAYSGTSRAKRAGTRTAHLVASRLRQAFELAADRKLILNSPMRGVVLPKDKPAKITPPNETQIATMLCAARTRPDAALWYLYALLGLRRGEGIGVRWSDIDWTAETITIAQQVQASVGLGRFVSDPKSDAGTRILPLPRTVLDLLKAHRVAQLQQRIKRANTWIDTDLVFCNRDGGALWPRFIDKHWHTLRTASNIQGATLHHLRHAVATLLDEAGASEALKQGILGHEAGTVTQRYTHARIDAMRRVLETVADRVLSDHTLIDSLIVKQKP